MIDGLAAAALALASAGATAQQPAATDTAEPRSALIVQALAYEHGEGVARDPLRAAALYCEAARDGDAEGMFGLGWMYANGRGVARDDAVAAALFARAAALGHEYARRMLGMVAAAEGDMPACMRPPPPPPAAEAEPDDEFDPFATLPPPKLKIANMVRNAAPTFGIDPRLALAIVAVESDFEPSARSPKDARGVMQLIGGTATRFKVANRMDVAQNVRGGLAYLRWLLAYYEGRVKLAVAAYNAGEAAVDRYGGVPPYRETRDYVRRVLILFPNERHPYDPAVVEPSRAVTHSDSARN